MSAAMCDMGLYCKVGVSDDPIKRVAEVQTGCPHKIVAVTYVPLKSKAHARRAERLLHQAFRHNRTVGEWFLFEENADWANVLYPLSQLTSNDIRVYEV